MAAPDSWISRFLKRSGLRARNQLGIVPYPVDDEGKVRSPKLELLDAYYEGKQYDHLQSWFDSSRERYIPIRQRKPLINYSFGKVLCQRVTSKLIGQSVFPTFTIEEDPDTEEYLKLVVKASKMKSRLLEPVRRMLASGSVLVRFYLSEGSLKIEHYLGKYCYPEMDENGELESVTIKYVYESHDEKDTDGNPLRLWYQMELGKMTDILYQPVKFEANVPPEQIPQQTVDHQLGFVQAEWFRTCEQKHCPDGYSLLEDIMEFIDEINYSLSQSSSAVSYNQDPQLTFSKMDDEEMSGLIRSATKAWNLGRLGEAKFLESNLTGVERANELRTIMRQGISDVARIVFLDPEKIVSSAQSGEAMKVLHGPLVELIDELRPVIEERIMALTIKMGVMILMQNSIGAQVPITIPPGFAPKSLGMEFSWPPIFPQTIEDLQKKASLVNTVTAGNLISRETGTRFLARDFGVDNVEEEVQKIAAQPVINPFGGF